MGETAIQEVATIKEEGSIIVENDQQQILQRSTSEIRNLSTGEQVKRLINIFSSPPVTMAFHQTPNGKIQPCCEAALTTFSTSLQNQFGLFGALTQLSSLFKWGFARCEHACECVTQTDNLDCGSGMSIALTLLNPIKENHLLASVEVVVRHSQFNTTIWKHRITEENPEMTPEELERKMIWIEQDCHYHTCIGLISPDNTSDEWDLKVWDYGLWILPSHSPHAFNARLAIRVKLHSDHDSHPNLPKLRWGNLSISAGEWINLWPNVDQVPSHDLIPTSSSLPSKIFISGCHMSGSPCPGIGLARSLRVHYPATHLVAVDTAEDLNNGSSDPIFNSRLSLPGVMAPSFSGEYSDWQVLEWDLVYELLSTDPAAIYLPSRDSDVDIIALALHSFCTNHKPPMIRSSNHSNTFDLDLPDRVLCPSMRALDAMAKPGIYGANRDTPISDDCHPIRSFQIPEYLDLGVSCKSLYELQNFCNLVGYPVILKGSRQGAAICHGWPAVAGNVKQKWARDGYVQKLVVGFSMGLCFAAYKGELLGAVLMQKNVATADGKAWGGELREVPPDMLNDLILFCKSVSFTGGSELEYVEDIHGSKWAIDWNPRFPAFIYATHLAGLNLPAMLLSRCVEDMRTRNTYQISHWESLPLSPAAPSRLTLTKDSGMNFTRTVIETVDTLGVSARTGGGGTMIFPGYSGKSRNHNHKTEEHKHHHKEMLPNLPPLNLYKKSESAPHVDCDDEQNGSLLSESPSSSLSLSSSPTMSDPLIQTLERDLSFFASHAAPTPDTQTPYYVLSTAAAKHSLNTQKDALDRMLLRWKSSLPDGSSCFSIQPFLSVKTQPHQSLLRNARECGFYAECITIAEIRAALAAGFTEDQIILTGPGKFWEGPNTFVLPKTLKLRAIFADSLEDLRRIVSFTTNPPPGCPLGAAEIIGVRLSLGGKSRFGIDSSDPQTLLDTACLLKSLPENTKLGFHFHHASSNLGPKAWWCGLESFLALTASIATISDKTVKILDFGGGWQPHFLSHKDTEDGMMRIFSLMTKYHPFIETVQFEPGKSVSERCGALVCRVLEIREYVRSCESSYPKEPSSSSSSSSGLEKTDQPEESFLYADNEMTISPSSSSSTLTANPSPSATTSSSSDRRACIVDACIAELSVSALHVHPLLWRPRISTGSNITAAAESWSILDHDGTTKGSDVIWGRSCMEFDVISSNVILPTELSVGDYVMIAFTGAYDTVMQYSFADGLGRPLQVIA
jgi:diaminopimelate decarboxylase